MNGRKSDFWRPGRLDILPKLMWTVANLACALYVIAMVVCGVIYGTQMQRQCSWANCH